MFLNVCSTISRLSNRNTMMTVIIQKLKSTSLDQDSSVLNLLYTETTDDHKEGIILPLSLFTLFTRKFVILIFVMETIFTQVYSNSDKFPGNFPFATKWLCFRSQLRRFVSSLPYVHKCSPSKGLLPFVFFLTGLTMIFSALKSYPT